LTVKRLEELPEVLLRVVGARRGLRVVLDGEDGVLPVADSFYGAIIEVNVCDLK
jgi:hypothetical protein